MIDTPKSLAQVIANLDYIMPDNDLVHMFVPLMRQIGKMHDNGCVANLSPSEIIENANGSLALKSAEGQSPKYNKSAIAKVQPQVNSALNIIGDLQVTHGGDRGIQVDDLLVMDDGEDPIITKPVFVTGYRSWEQLLGHHDPLTDIYNLGQLMAALACNLDLTDTGHLKQLSKYRTNLYRLNPHLHPVIATMIEGMTNLNRYERESDIIALAHRLENYRDQLGRLNAEQILSEVEELPERRVAILSHLRDRLFDLSRRNRLIHFKPTQANVNLTISSVPLVMNVESIRPDQLCTWGGKFEKSVLSGKSVLLNQWLRFEDQPYLPSSLNRIIQQYRRDKAEFGFSNLCLVLGFFTWYNLKDSSHEKITSPLLWLKVDLSKKKGVRDQYIIKSEERIAEFNPALRHYLKQLYDINLPETVDLETQSLADIHKDISEKINRTEPSVALSLTTQPSIRLVHQKAMKRLRQYQKRKGLKSTGPLNLPIFNYGKGEFKPLGRAIFENHILPKAFPQRSELGGGSTARPDFIVPSASTASSETFTMDKDDKGKFGWEIDLAQVTLANFNYRKMSLVRDYASLIEKSEENSALDGLFSISPKEVDMEKIPPLDAADQWSVVASDSTQNQAVALARSNKNFIIQGPPGTGKSQTITNLISDFVAQGKRVLFVCEKRAALDVVYNRLKQAGLSDLATLIHDSQDDKKSFIMDLKSRYETWIKSDPEWDKYKSERGHIIAACDQNFRPIIEFEKFMSSSPDDEGQNYRQLITRQMSHSINLDHIGPELRERLPTPSQWDSNQTIINQSSAVVKQLFGADSIAEMPHAHLSRSVIEAEDSYAKTKSFVDLAEPLCDDVLDIIESCNAFTNDPLSADQAHKMIDYAHQIEETGLSENLSLLDTKSPLSQSIKQHAQDIEDLEEELRSAIDNAENWHQKLSYEDTKNAIEVISKNETSFLKLLKSQWRSVKKTIDNSYDFGSHSIKPSYASVIEKLRLFYAASEAIENKNQELETLFNSRKPTELLKLRSEINSAILENRLLANFVASDNNLLKDDVLKLSSVHGKMSKLHEALSYNLGGISDITLSEVAEIVRDIRENLEDLPSIIPVLQQSYKMDAKAGYILRHVKMNIASLEALVVDEALSSKIRQEPYIQNFTLQKLSDCSLRSAKAKELLLDKNAEYIVSTVHLNFLKHVRHSTLSITGLDDKEKQFKKIYANGRRELEHEFGKSMRYKSIREVSSGDTGAVVSDLKPIWLMSPLSVSDTLPLETDLFDVVIFDEASQIPVEDGIPALCRAPQLIVVGDEMQLPPTSFFSSTVDDEDRELEVQENGEQFNIALDADSLLTQSARHMPATLLAWHYRSRSEALISFSNAAFYNGNLVTIPDQKITTRLALEEPVSSDEKNGAAKACERLLEAPLSYHIVKDGVYESRSNIPEAKLIAKMVKELLDSDNEKTIGIVAFSEAQQSCIETELEALASKNSDFATQLDEEYNREDDGEFNGLFVKNLENVQGDERDIIILSICYAPGRSGKMVMNFGPINQRGGEKRLNVIFSRAKHHMAVVSTIRSDAITNTHNDGANALRTFLAFAEARASGNVERGRAALASINTDIQDIFTDAPPVDPIRDAMAMALRESGLIVEEYVGSAAFRCDLAILDPSGKHYNLAILLDSDQPDGNAASYERFVFKPSILRAFGWRVIDVTRHSWRDDPDHVIAFINTELGRLDQEPIEVDPFADILSPAPLTVPRTTKKKSKPGIVAIDDQKFQEFHFKKGNSDKFWRIARNGNDLTIQYGRNGTKGQSVIKSFDSEDRAKRESNKLILEKTRKGYQEV